jgi:hypothetical protein
LAIRESGDLALFHYWVEFYEWVNCNPAGNSRRYLVLRNFAVSDLSTLVPDWNDTIASVRVTIFDTTP